MLDDSGATIAHRITQLTNVGTHPGRIAKILNKRSGKRGAEPEGLAHLRIASTEHIYVGLVRAGLIAHFVCDEPYYTIHLVGLIEIPAPTPDGPLASPEGLVVVPGRLGTPALLAIADEVHSTVTIFSVATRP